MCLEAINLLVVVFCKFFIRQRNLSLMKINRYKVVKELKSKIQLQPLHADSLDSGGGGGGLAHYSTYCSINLLVILFHVASMLSCQVLNGLIVKPVLKDDYFDERIEKRKMLS
uniref:Uncharacterized protein n=1 Tax=Glossina austeni TaxID=7395 RepID=A0A1A9UML5_GLOAU